MPLIRKPNFPVAKRGRIFKKSRNLPLKKSVWELRKIYAAKRGDGLNFQVPSPEAQPFGKKNLGEGGEKKRVASDIERGKMGSKSVPFQDRGGGGGGGEAEN